MDDEEQPEPAICAIDLIRVLQRQFDDSVIIDGVTVDHKNLKLTVAYREWASDTKREFTEEWRPR